jgi:glycosyltransferase involved in cell wall biosynthesis
LVIAEYANPNWSSVPLVGWAHWHALSEIVDGHLVTHGHNKENILAAGENPDRVTWIDATRVSRNVNRFASALGSGARGGLTTMTALSVVTSLYFERLLWRQLGARIRAGEWDIVHRLTPLTPVTPSFLAARCSRHGIPFVLGPLNGGLGWPKGFSKARWAEGEWLTYVREAYRLLPGYRLTRRSSSAIVVGSMDTHAQIAAPYRNKLVYIPENGIDVSRFVRHKTEPVVSPLKVGFVGRLTLYKGADMLIEALAPLVRAGRVEMDIIGDGPQNASLRALAAHEGLPSTMFAGWLQHDELVQRLSRSDVFAFPSIREFGGGVVLEAMALGLVPVVVDYGGPAELASPATGFLIPMGSRASIVRAFRETIENLANDPSKIRDLGTRARGRVLKNFTWEVKASQMLEVYRWVLGERPRPDFGMPMPD